jgi:hypothetical protein
MEGSSMNPASPSKPNSATLKQALKLQTEAQRLIIGGYAYAPADSDEGQAVTAWTLERQYLARRVPATLMDGQILLHFAAQALEAIPSAVENGATAEAHLFAAEASAAIASVGTFLAKSTGKTPRDFGLFNAFFPESLH